MQGWRNRRWKRLGGSWVLRGMQYEGGMPMMVLEQLVRLGLEWQDVPWWVALPIVPQRLGLILGRYLVEA